MKVLALIPARSGSKSVPDKNIRLIGGIPMLAHSIRHAQESKYINRIILSTDSEKYAQVGRDFGAETPFLRPAEYAGDDSTDLEVFTHALLWLKENEGYEPDIVVQLRPTYPKRRASDIDAMIEMLLNDTEADSVRSIAPAKEIAYKMWFLNGENGTLSPIMTDIPECYNMPRQKLPSIYYQNASIDIMRPATVLEQRSMTGKKILGYLMDENIDIDTEEDFRQAAKTIEGDQGTKEDNRNGENGASSRNGENGANNRNGEDGEDNRNGANDEKTAVSEQLMNCLENGKKRFVFDIDGVIAKLQPQNDYVLSEPDERMIAAVNRLYDAGNEIILHTARGYVTGKDWTEVTVNQLKKWGLKYHELHFGKPNADYYIDDKMISADAVIKAAELPF